MYLVWNWYENSHTFNSVKISYRSTEDFLFCWGIQYRSAQNLKEANRRTLNKLSFNMWSTATIKNFSFTFVGLRTHVDYMAQESLKSLVFFVSCTVRTHILQWWAKWRLSTFDLYHWGEGHDVQGQICDILRPQLAMNRFLPLWPHRFPHFGNIHLGGGGVGGLWY
jgi:hypothetical protein